MNRTKEDLGAIIPAGAESHLEWRLHKLDIFITLGLENLGELSQRQIRLATLIEQGAGMIDIHITLCPFETVELKKRLDSIDELIEDFYKVLH